jgi:DNA polymerase-3 subunit epsilon
VCVENGNFLGFGYIDQSLLVNDIELLKDAIKKYPDNRDTYTIIKHFIGNNKVERIISY